MASCKKNESESSSAQSLTNINTSRTPVTPPPTLAEKLKIEREIINAITSGKSDSLKANSGQAITFGDHYVCVSCHDDSELNCRVWEWHGYIVSYNVVHGYDQEYMNGSYFERLMTNITDVTEEEIVVEEEEEEPEDDMMGIEWGLSGLFSGLNFMDRRRDSWRRNWRGNSRRF